MSIKEKLLHRAIKALGTEDLAIQLPWPESARLNLTPEYVVFQSESDVRRSRAATQYDGYGQYIVEMLVNNVVGPAGIKVIWEDPTLQKLWDEWRWNPVRDYERVDEAERDVIRGVIRDGESITQIIGDPTELSLVILDPLDLPPHPSNDSIEYDHKRRPVKYKFRPRYGYRDTPIPPPSLPADQVVHIYREDYPNQRRGVSWMRSAVTPLQKLKEFEDAYGETAQLSAANPGFFSLPARLSALLSENDTLESLKRAAKVNPKTRQILPEGTDWVPAGSPNISGGTYEAVKKGYLSRVARAVGISYYSLSSDLSDASFSSARQGHLENVVLYKRLQAMVIGWLEVVTDRWFMWNSMRYGVSNPSRDYSPPGFDYIDPAKETSALAAAVELGIKSRSEIIMESGRNPEVVFKSLAEEEAQMKVYRQEAMEKAGLDGGDSDSGNESDDDDEGADDQRNPNPNAPPPPNPSGQPGPNPRTLQIVA